MSEVAGDLFPSEPERRPALAVKNGAVFANSRDVAEFFGKRHDHVLDAIGNILSQGKPENSGLLGWFIEQVAERPGGGRPLRSFDMTRDGFALLTFGFTGPEAFQWKLKYIEAFNTMEAELRARALDPVELFKDPSRLLPLLESYARDKQQLTAQVETMRPKVEAHDRIAGLDGSFCVRDAAKMLQTPETLVWRYMKANNWVYQRPGTSAWLAYSHRIAADLLTHKVMEYTRSDGVVSTRTQVRVTAKGLTVLAKAFPPKVRLV